MMPEPSAGQLRCRTADEGVPPTRARRGWILDRTRIQPRPRWTADASRPCNRLVLAQRQQRSSFSENTSSYSPCRRRERERLGKRSAAGHDLRLVTRQQIDGGELLEYAHRIVRAEHRHRTRQPNLRRPDRRAPSTTAGATRRSRAMMLADAKDIAPTWSASSISRSGS